MRKLKLLSMLALCLTVLLTSACSSNTTAVSKDPKEAVTNACQKLNSLKNYHMSMVIESSLNVNGQPVKSTAKGEMKIQKSPLLCENIMEITADAPSKISQKITQYMEESGDQLIMYSNINNHWMKQILPKTTQSPAAQFEGYIKAITSVTQKSEDENSIVYEVVASGNELKKEYRKPNGWLDGTKPKNS